MKYAWHFVGGINKRVAPYTGAWIEISAPPELVSRLSTSLPTRERGLKSVRRVNPRLKDGSLPTRERGLKLYLHLHQIENRGRSLHGSVD